MSIELNAQHAAAPDQPNARMLTGCEIEKILRLVGRFKDETNCATIYAEINDLIAALNRG